MLGRNKRPNGQNNHRLPPTHRAYGVIGKATGPGDQSLLPGARFRHLHRQEGEAMAHRSQPVTEFLRGLAPRPGGEVRRAD